MTARVAHTRRAVCGLALVFGVLLYLSAAELRAAGTLVNNGVAASCIIIPAGTAGRVQTAAQDLAGYLQQMSGATIPVVSDAGSPSGYKILIGSTGIAPVSPADVTEEKIGYDGFIIESVPGGVVIAGRNDQGTANGVYHFAEEVLGIHWYSVEDDGPTVPARSTVTIPDLNLTVKPDSPWRGQYFSFQDTQPEYINRTIPLAQKLGLNRDRWWTFNRLWGIEGETGHAMSQIVPASLFNFYPDYFPFIDYTFEPGTGKLIQADANGNLPYYPWKSGRYAGDGSFQRCFSNRGVQSKAIFHTAQRFASDPNIRYASLSANDGPWWCECSNCKTFGSTRTNQMVNFANAVAAGNKAEYPGRFYCFVAYWDTLDPPTGVTCDASLLPMIAPLWQCRIHPISSNCPDMVYLRQVYRGWDQAAARLAWRPYISDGVFTFPGVIAAAEEMRFARDHGSIGGFREHQFKPAVNWQMLTWMEVKLLWDVDQDPVLLRRQFIEGYYGLAAADAVERVYAGIEDSLRATVDDRTWPRDDGAGLHSLQSEAVLRPIMRNLKGYVEAALAAAQTQPEPYRSRVIRDMTALPSSAPAFYEGFNYAAGSTIGPQGGWTTYPDNSPFTIQTTGASYTDAAGNKLAVSGRSAYQTVAGNRYVHVKRDLPQEVSDLFATEGTFYITMLLREQNDVVFRTTSSGKYLDLGTYPQTVGHYYFIAEGPGKAIRTASYWYGQQYDLYAIRIVNRAGHGQLDEITVLRNPNLQNPDWNNAGDVHRVYNNQTDITASDYSYFYIWGGGQSTQLGGQFAEWVGGIDEIRIGREWSNVVPSYTPAAIRSAKMMMDGEPVQCSGTVTASFNGFLYIGASNRTSGIRVEKPGFAASVGQEATVYGIVSTLPSGERCVAANSITQVSGTPLRPLGMSNRSLGGADYGAMPDLGQRGVLGGLGPNNIGLLVKTTGLVTEKDASAAPPWFVITDGSGVSVKVIGPVPAGHPYVAITGISSCERVEGYLERVLLATELEVMQ